MQNVLKCLLNVIFVVRKKYLEIRYFFIQFCELNWFYKNIICVEYIVKYICIYKVNLDKLRYVQFINNLLDFLRYVYVFMYDFY